MPCFPSNPANSSWLSRSTFEQSLMNHRQHTGNFCFLHVVLLNIDGFLIVQSPLLYHEEYCGYSTYQRSSAMTSQTIERLSLVNQFSYKIGEGLAFGFWLGFGLGFFQNGSYIFDKIIVSYRYLKVIPKLISFPIVLLHYTDG